MLALLASAPALSGLSGVFLFIGGNYVGHLLLAMGWTFMVLDYADLSDTSVVRQWVAYCGDISSVLFFSILDVIWALGHFFSSSSLKPQLFLMKTTLCKY